MLEKIKMLFDKMDDVEKASVKMALSPDTASWSVKKFLDVISKLDEAEKNDFINTISWGANKDEEENGMPEHIKNIKSMYDQLDDNGKSMFIKSCKSGDC